MTIITAVAFTLERPAIKLGPRSKSPEIQFGPCMNQISTKVISFWFGSSWKFTFQGFSHRFSISLDVFCKKNTGIYFDFVETDNTRDGWYLWCSICINLNAVFKKCLVISYCPTVSSCVYVYIYVLINFWLCYVIKFTWMIQQRWKTFDATVRIGFCPFLTLKN